MTVVLDTNTVLQMFGARSPLVRLKNALLSGRVTVAISTGIWLEYEEVVVRYAGVAVWTRVARIFELAEQLRGNVLTSSRRSLSGSSLPTPMTTSLLIAPSRPELIS